MSTALYQPLDTALMLDLLQHVDPALVHIDGCVTVNLDSLMGLLHGIISATAKGAIVPVMKMSDARH